MKFVSIVMGSKNDYIVMNSCSKILKDFGVKYELVVSSAHRSPERTATYIQEAEAKGAQVFIAAAGMAAHLAGVLSSKTVKPIIGVPMDASALSGMDALLSTVQMPAGMPVATVAIGKAGAINSAYLAMQILALDDEELSIKLKEDRIAKAKKVEMDSMEIETIIDGNLPDPY
ncbi:MAG: 5-(carboxyamino)imidazole ribonucleotide mutase [Sulfurimonas sp.]|nr:5-(carboxyamino)imidazole ribonucleotide mutase [Sulfurimonas sp.]